MTFESQNYKLERIVLCLLLHTQTQIGDLKFYLDEDEQIGLPHPTNIQGILWSMRKLRLSERSSARFCRVVHACTGIAISACRPGLIAATLVTSMAGLQQPIQRGSSYTLSSSPVWICRSSLRRCHFVTRPDLYEELQLR